MAILTINNAACNVVQYPVEYGLMYNWHVVGDAKKISSSDDWVVPTDTNWSTLSTYLGGVSIAGDTMKETGTTYWTVGGSNTSGFNGRGSGERNYSTGAFANLGVVSFMWSSTLNGGIYPWYRLLNSSTKLGRNYVQKSYGYAIRLLYVGAGTPTAYTGNDGKVYRIILIGTQYWLADNLAETRFRDNSIIPWYGTNPANYFTDAEWASLPTAGVCAYANTTSNVAPGFTFPS